MPNKNAQDNGYKFVWFSKESYSREKMKMKVLLVMKKIDLDKIA